MPKLAPKAPAECVALYETLLATIPSIERKGATMPYTSHNGNMFTLMTPEGFLALRLSEPDRNAFLKKYKATQPVQYGVVMKEYVQVPDNLLKKTRELAPYLEKSWQYVQSLKPKATKKAMEKKVLKADAEFLAESLADVDAGRTRPALEALDGLASKYRLLKKKLK